MRVRVEAGKITETTAKSRQEMVAAYTEIVVRETEKWTDFIYIFWRNRKSADRLKLENE